MTFDTTNLCGAKTSRGYNISTASGKPFWPAAPRIEDVRIEDIAVHLSRLCRFNGALKDGEFVGRGARRKFITFEIYAVAQHCVLVERNYHKANPNASTNARLAALLHDAAEGYIGDMIKPNKAMYPDRKKHESRISRVIEKRFGLKPNSLDDPRIKAQDYRAVLTEHRDLLKVTGEVDWNLASAEAEPWPEKIRPVLPSVARRMFLDKFNELYLGE